MPRYFFDLYDGDGLFADNNGTVFENDELAHREAAQTLTEITRDNLPTDGAWRNLRIVVRSAEGNTLWETLLHWETRRPPES
jgi:hypothetical protein